MGTVFLGIRENELCEMTPCALYKPTENDRRGQINTRIYELFKMTGSPYKGEVDCEFRPFSLPTFGSSKFGFVRSERRLNDVDWEAWQVPCWAIAFALQMRSIVDKAESIGREQGYTSGLKVGKSILPQLAKGEISLNEFEKIDGRDPIRLNSKTW